MKKIAIDVREFKNGKMTGIGRYLKNLIVNFGKYYENFEFILFGDKFTEIPFDIPKYCRFDKINSFSVQVWEQISLKKVLRIEKPDIYFSPYYKRPLNIDIPSLITVHDIIPLLYPISFSDRFILKRLIKTYSEGSQIVTVSENSKKDIEEIVGIAGSKINVVYNAVDNVVFGKLNKEYAKKVLEKLGLKEKYIFYSGNFSAHKNLNLLIKAYGFLPDKVKKEYSLVFCGGDSVFKDKPKELICIKSVSDEELASLYFGASLFVYPSLYEGFGFPPLEAMACGCPVLSSNASCMPEILGDAAEYFDPYGEKELAFKIETILSDVKTAEIMSSRGIKKAGLYTVEKFCAGIHKVFNNLIGA
ncbi:MAG: glycosyltransferase family 4 protein [Elusimicrobia bacterium]|nr:glycosyltransferase family 4 protein [Elusimicrobiota bacterium]